MLSVLFRSDLIDLPLLQSEQINILIEKIVNGCLSYPQIAKLAGITYQQEAVYRARINEKDRLIFTYVGEAEKRRLLLLAINDHNYKKLKRQLTFGTYNHNIASLEDIIEQHGESAALSAQTSELPVLSKTASEFSYKSAIGYNGSTLVLDEKQQQTYLYQDSGALILSGAPGAGKSSLLYSMLLKRLEAHMVVSGDKPLAMHLFVSPSPSLVAFHQELYQQDHYDNLAAVRFTTWNDLLLTHYPMRKLIDSEAFNKWLVMQKIEHKANLVHYEFSLIKSFRDFSKDQENPDHHYLSLGQRQCHFSGNDLAQAVQNEREQQRLIRLLEQWEAYLDENSLLDPMVSCLPAKNQVRYGSISIDETQNMPPNALNNLIPRTENQQFFAALDSDQCLFSSAFVPNCLKQLLYKFYGTAQWQGYSEHYLTTDWRSLPEITTIGNHLLDSKYAFDNHDKRRPYPNIKSAHQEQALVSWVDAKNTHKLQVYGQRAATVVVVAESPNQGLREQIKQQYGCNNILTAAEAIGLDFETVILHNLLSQSVHFRGLSKHPQQTALSMEQLNAINSLYVAIKRAKKRLFLFDSEYTRYKKLAEQLLGKIAHNTFDAQPIAVVVLAEEIKQLKKQLAYHLGENNQVEVARLNEELAAMAVVTADVPQNNIKPAVTINAPIELKAEVEGKLHKIRHEKNIKKQSKLLIEVLEHVTRPLITDSAGVQNLVPWFCAEHPNEVAFVVKAMLREFKNKANNKLLATDKSLMSLFAQSNGFCLFNTALPVLLKEMAELISFIIPLLNKEELVCSLQKSYEQQKLKETMQKLINESKKPALIDALCALKTIGGLPGGDTLVSSNPASIKAHELFKAVNDNDLATLQRYYAEGFTLDVVTSLAGINTSLVAHAIQCDKLQVLKFLYVKGVNFDAAAGLGLAPIHFAIHSKSPETLCFLHQIGVNFAATTKVNQTIAHLVVKNDNLAMFKILFKLNLIFDVKDYSEYTPLDYVISTNGSIFTYVLEEDCSWFNKLAGELRVGLMGAATQGKAEPFIRLHKKGINLNQVAGQYCLYAITSNQTKVDHQLVFIEQLHHFGLDIGNNLFADPSCKQTLAHTAAGMDKIKVLELLHKLNITRDDRSVLIAPALSGDTPLTFAVTGGHIVPMAFILKHYPEQAVAVDIYGVRAIHHAARTNKVNVASILLSCKEVGVSLEAKTGEGFTPAACAAIEGHKEFIDFLLNKGACKGRGRIIDADETINPEAVANNINLEYIQTVIERYKAGRNVVDNGFCKHNADKLKTFPRLVTQLASLVTIDYAEFHPHEFALVCGHYELAQYILDHSNYKENKEERPKPIGFFSNQEHVAESVEGNHLTIGPRPSH